MDVVDDITSLVNLSSLYVDMGSGIDDDSAVLLTSIRRLGLAYNYSIIDKTIFALNQLEYINLQANDIITGASVKQLTSLTRLVVTGLSVI